VIAVELCHTGTFAGRPERKTCARAPRRISDRKFATIFHRVSGTSFAPSLVQMDTKPYLDCLGCGLVLRGYKGFAPQTLCVDCRRFAGFATRGTQCVQCGSKAVLCCTERNGFETLFCTSCDRVWSHAASSVETGNAERLLPKRTRWAGVERRTMSSGVADAAVSGFRKAG